MPKFHDKSIIEYDVHVTNKKSRYDMIIGRDLIKAFKLELDFNDDMIIWNNNSVLIKDTEKVELLNYVISDSESMEEATERMRKILDAKYEAADLNEVVASCEQLSYSEVIGQKKSMISNSDRTPNHIMLGHI